MLTKRTRAGQTITYVYDDLNRLTSRVVPGPGNPQTYSFEYDLNGRRTRSSVDGFHQDYTYDAGDRLISQFYSQNTTTAGKEAKVFYRYDKGSNVTRITHPDSHWVQYKYDLLNRVTRVCENRDSSSCLATSAPTAELTYDRLSRRTSLAYKNGASAKYAYTARGDLTCLDWNFSGATPTACNTGAPELAYDMSYNGAGQLRNEKVSTPDYFWEPAGAAVEDYVSNGLNQYASITPQGGPAAAIVHDMNGNITTDHRGRGYEYDAENRLDRVRDTPGGGVTLLRTLPWGDGTMRYSFDGAASRYYFDGLAGVGAPANQEIVETYNNAANDFKDNKVKRRYIRLPGSVDEVLLMREYDSAGTLTAIRYVHANRLGSVVALTTTSGYAIDKYAYSPYGEAGVGGSSGFPFRFTGQKLFASVDLYYYKARWYDPETGRFLQTDPIGYEDQMNLYAYVHNDPANGTDPTGEDTVSCTVGPTATGGITVVCSQEVDTSTDDTEFILVDKDGNETSVGTLPGVRPLTENVLVVESIFEVAGFRSSSPPRTQPGAETYPYRGDLPSDNASNYEPVRGTSAKRNRKTGEIWVKDRLHKDHYEVYKNKRDFENGKRSYAVWDDGRFKESF